MLNPENPHCLFRPGSPSFYVLIISCALFLLATPLFILLGSIVYYEQATTNPWSASPRDKGIAYAIGICIAITTLIVLYLGTILIRHFARVLTMSAPLCSGLSEEISNSAAWAHKRTDYGAIPAGEV